MTESQPRVIDDGLGPLRNAYVQVYALICGRHPFLRPWHYEWLATKHLAGELRRILPELRGRVLDVGCGDRPYRGLLRRADAYVGIDVSPKADADIIVQTGLRWPLEDASFDVVLSTEVLEHASDLDHVLDEIARVLRPGGTVVISVPFLYGEHGAPGDFRRFSIHGAALLFPRDWQIVALKRLGGAGSAIGTLFLEWIELSLSASRPTRLLQGVLMPVWIVLSAFVNLLGTAADALDRTSAFYVDLLISLRKPESPTVERPR